MVLRKKTSDIDKNLVQSLINECGLSKDICEVMAMRGIVNIDGINKFLYPNLSDLTPVFDYDGMSEAVTRIKTAITAGEKIVIYGDYDCDGVCATAILYLFFTSLGLETYYYIPNRKRDGYGIHREALEEIAENYYPDLIITVDCGISAKEDIEYAQNELGLDFIVTDHHEPPDELPDCIIIDPKIKRYNHTFNELCGAGIALRLCEAIGGEKALAYYLDIACLATIGDIVPLLGDNRILVSYGMQIINSRARQCFKLLLESVTAYNTDRLTSTDIAFRIVPKINAVGRLSDSMKAVSLLVDDDYFYVKSLVEQATQLNNERQKITDDLVAESLKLLEDYDLASNRFIVLYSENWEAGVLGIAAAKLVNMFNRPVILMTLCGDEYKGSCRSIDGIDMYESLKACSSFLNGYGGHSMACGLSVGKKSIDGFVTAINEYAHKYDDSIFLPYMDYDFDINIENITPDFLERMNILEPFGMGNPPISYLTRLYDNQFEQIGSSKHIKCIINDEKEYVYFDGVKQLNIINNSFNKEIIATFNNRIYNNRKYAQGMVKYVGIDHKEYIVDNDLLAVKYLYGAKYDEKSIFDIEYIDDSELENCIADSIYGACFVCYNYDTLIKYSKILDKKIIETDIGGFKSVNPYNRLVLDMDITQNLAYYDKVIFLDKPLKEGIIDYLKLNKDCKIFILKKDIDKFAIDSVRKAFPNLERMRNIFVKIRELLNVKCYTMISALYEDYRKKYTDADIIQFYIAFYVFYELKIIVNKNGFHIDKTVKTKLDNSNIYISIKEVIGG